MSTLYYFFSYSSLYSCFLYVSDSFFQLLTLSQCLTWLLLRVVMPTSRLENWSRERIFFCFACLCEVLTSQFPSFMNWMHKYGKQLCDIGLTLKLLHICFCFVKTLNVLFFILVLVCMLKIRKIKKINEVGKEFYRQVVSFLFKRNCKHISNTLHRSNL